MKVWQWMYCSLNGMRQLEDNRKNDARDKMHEDKTGDNFEEGNAGNEDRDSEKDEIVKYFSGNDLGELLYVLGRGLGIHLVTGVFGKLYKIFKRAPIQRHDAI